MGMSIILSCNTRTAWFNTVLSHYLPSQKLWRYLRIALRIHDKVKSVSWWVDLIGMNTASHSGSYTTFSFGHSTWSMSVILHSPLLPDSIIVDIFCQTQSLFPTAREKNGVYKFLALIYSRSGQPVVCLPRVAQVDCGWHVADSGGKKEKLHNVRYGRD